MHSMDLQHVRSSSIATNASSTQRSALTIFTRSAAGMNGLPAIVRARRMMRWQRQRASAAQRQATTPRQQDKGGTIQAAAQHVRDTAREACGARACQHLQVCLMALQAREACSAALHRPAMVSWLG